MQTLLGFRATHQSGQSQVEDMKLYSVCVTDTSDIMFSKSEFQAFQAVFVAAEMNHLLLHVNKIAD